MVTDRVKKFSEKLKGRLHNDVNIEAIQLLDQRGLVTRVGRTKCFELIYCVQNMECLVLFMLLF